MKISKAINIIKSIDNDQFTEDEKALAIYEVLKMPTHMSITKDDSLNVTKYLFNLIYEVVEPEGE